MNRSDLRAAHSGAREPVPTLTITGRVGLPSTLAWPALRQAAHRRDDGRLALPLVDVLSFARLSSDADLIVVNDASGDSSLAVPVRDAIANDDAALLFQGNSVRLDVPGWTEPGEPQPVATIVAITFQELLGCR